MILEKQIIKLRESNKLLKKERDMYKKAYSELSCYFDSISDEEQEKVAKKLERIFKTKLK
jgi:hypothetical protein